LEVCEHKITFRKGGVPVFFRIGLDVGSGVKVRKPHAEQRSGSPCTCPSRETASVRSGVHTEGLVALQFGEGVVKFRKVALKPL
jgi:hypothetical protein